MARKDRYDYFAALHEIAMQCTESAQLLSEVVSRLDKDAAEAEETVAKGKLIANKSEALLAKLFERAAADFITPLDRGDMIELATCIAAKAWVSPSSTRIRSALLRLTTSMNWRISSSRLSLRSLWPRLAVFKRPFNWLSTIRVGVIAVLAKKHHLRFI